MSSLINSQIEIKTKIIVFSDGTSVKQRSSNVISKGDSVAFSLDITGIELKEAEIIRNQIEKELLTIENINKVNIVLTSARDNAKDTKEQKPKIHIDGIKKVIVIAAGKGGVGKSTIASLLAQKLALQGKRVGLLDADIYGPSIPNIFSLKGKPGLEDNKMVPLHNFNVFVNSIGFLTAPGASVSWRGPMTTKALYQLLSLTKWGNLDYLLIDTPPGTGDIHLSILENYIVDAVVMVTTPQVISKLDVIRSINLYQKFSVPITGIIENMSYYLDENNGNKIQLFSGNSAEEISKENNIPLLAKMPINPALSKACDQGESLEPFIDLIKFDI